MRLIGEIIYNQPLINRNFSQMMLMINFLQMAALILSLDDQYENHKVDRIFEYFRHFTQVFLLAPILKDNYKMQQTIIVIIALFTILPYFILVVIYIILKYEYSQGRLFKNLLTYINLYATLLRIILYIPLSSILLDGCICENKLLNCNSTIQVISIIIFINICLQLYVQAYLIRLIEFKPYNLFQPMFNFSILPKCLMFTGIMLLSKYVTYDFLNYMEMILLNLILIFNLSESIINYINNFQINYHIFVFSMLNFSLVSINEVIILQQKQSMYTQNMFITIILIFALIFPLSKQVFKIALYNVNCQQTNNQNKIIYATQIIQSFCNNLQNQVKDEQFFEIHKLARHHINICFQCSKIRLTSIKQVRTLIQCILRQQNNRLQQELKYEFELLQLIYIDYISEELKKPLLAFVELKNYENHKFNLQSQYFRLIQRKLNNNLIQSIEKFNSETRNQFQKTEGSFDIKQLSTTFQNYDYIMPIIQRIIDQKMKYWQAQIRGFDSIYSQHKLGIQLMKLVQQVQGSFKNQQSSKSNNLIQMKLNAIYYGAIMNDYYNCAIQESLIMESLNYERTIQTENIYNLLLIEDRIALIQLSLLKHKGKIVNANKQNLALYFGFELKEFQNISLITQLMPQYVAEIHDSLLLGFLRKSQSKLFNQYASIFSIDSQNYLIHSQLKLEYNFLSADDFVLIGCMVKHKINQEFLLFDTEGKILGTSRSFFIDYIQSFDFKIDLNKFVNQCYIFLLFPGILQTLQGYKTQLSSNDQYLLIEENTFMFCRPNLLELIQNFNRYLNNNKRQAIEYHKSQGISIQIDNSASEFDAITYNGAEMTILDPLYVELIAKYVKGLDETQSIKHLVKYQIRHRSIGQDQYKRQYFEFEIIDIRRKAAGASQTIDSTNKNTFQDDRNLITSQTYLVNSSEGVKTDAINSEKPYQEVVPNEKEVQSSLQEIIKRLQGSKRNLKDQDSIQLFQIDSGRESMSFRPISQRANFMSPRINEQVEEESNQIDIDFNELQVQLNSISKVQENPDYQDQFEQSSVSLQKQHNEPSSEKKVSDQILKVMRKNKHDKNADDLDKSKSSINSGTSGSSATQIILKFQSAKHYTQGLKMISFINILVFLSSYIPKILQVISLDHSYTAEVIQTPQHFHGTQYFFQQALLMEAHFFFNQVYGDFQLINDNFFDELKANQDIFLEMEQTGLLNKQDYILNDDAQENQISFTYFTELIQENLFAIYEILRNKDQDISERLSDDYFDQLIQLRYNLNNVHLMSYNLIESLNTIFINQNQGYVGYQRTQTIIEIVVLFCIIFIQLYYWLLIERQIQQIILLAGRLQESDALELIARSMYIKDILNVQNGTWKKQNYYQICFEQIKKQNVDKVQSFAQIESQKQQINQQNNNKRKLNISLNSRIYKTQITLFQPILFSILAFLVLMLYFLGGFLLYQQESTNLLPQQKLLTEYIKFTSLFDTLMAQDWLKQICQIIVRYLQWNLIHQQLNHSKKYLTLIQITYPIFSQQIVKSSNMESSDKQILFNLYEKDYCLELVEDVPFCSYYSLGEQAWIDEFGQFYPKDNNLDFIAKGIVGVISQVDLLINQIFYNELETLNFEQNLTLVLEQISTKQFNNAVFFHFLDTNDATDLFQRIIFKSTLGILSQNLKQLLIYYLTAGIGCLICFSLSFIVWIRMTNMKLIRTRLLLICLPPHVLTDIHTLQILKQLK
ncbi:hypothetical protein pb186bvf_013967 [Paramecium bursaria]